MDAEYAVKNEEVKKISKKNLIIISFFVIAIVSMILVVGNNPVRKAKKFYEEGNLKAYKELEGKMQEDDLRKFGLYLADKADEIKKDYVTDKCSYVEAKDKILEISNYSSAKYVANYDEVFTFIEMMYRSKQAFESGIEFENDGDYVKACNMYLKVIEDDTNYEVAQDKLKDLQATVIEKLMSSAKSKAENKDYVGAIEEINEALQYVKNDSELNLLKDTYQGELELQKKAEEEAKKQAMILKANKEISNSKFEAKYIGAQVTTEILPENTNGNYSYHHADRGMTYLDIKFKLKNIDNTKVDISSLVDDLTCKYNLNYKYTKFSLFYSNDKSMNTANYYETIAPLQEVIYHIAIEIPEEVANTNFPISVEFTFLGEKQVLEFR